MSVGAEKPGVVRKGAVKIVAGPGDSSLRSRYLHYSSITPIKPPSTAPVAAPDCPLNSQPTIAPAMTPAKTAIMVFIKEK